MAGPACPACSSPREGTACQRISSHPSVFLIFFLPVCTSELVYLRGVTFHQRTGCGLIPVLFLHLPLPSLIPPSPGPRTRSSLSSSCLARPTANLLRFINILLSCLTLLFQLCHSTIIHLPDFLYLPLCPLFIFLFSPSHVSLVCLILEQSQ